MKMYRTFLSSEEFNGYRNNEPAMNLQKLRLQNGLKTGNKPYTFISRTPKENENLFELTSFQVIKGHTSRTHFDPK